MLLLKELSRAPRKPMLRLLVLAQALDQADVLSKLEAVPPPHKAPDLDKLAEP